MKCFKSIVVTVLLTVSASAFAQFTNSGSGSSMSASNQEGWSTFYVEWNPSSFQQKHYDDESFTGFSVGYNRATCVSGTVPLFVETGLGVQYSYWSGVGDIKLLSAKVPVELLYAWQLPNTSVTLIPHAGLNLRFNILGTLSFEGDDLNLFDKDDMDYNGSDVWKRFQVGWQIGVKARFNKGFMIGASYGTDFSEIVKNVKVATTSITLGYTF